jgi:hypothetical protein
MQLNTDHYVETTGSDFQMGREDGVLTLIRQSQLSGPRMLLIKAIVKRSFLLN